VGAEQGRLAAWWARRRHAHLSPVPTAEAWEVLCVQTAQRILAALHRQRLRLDEMQEAEQDPGRLAQLLELDEQMMLARRAAESLAILAGHTSPDTVGDRLASVRTLIRRAQSAVGPQHGRVDLGPVVELAVRPNVAAAAGRVLTELLDNALRFSPPQRRVSVSAHVTIDGAVLVRVQDTGIGLPGPRIEAINVVLAGPPPPLVPWQARQTGFAVAHREAHHHGLRVRLHPVEATAGTAAGTVATVLLPATVICEIPIPDRRPDTAVQTRPRRDRLTAGPCRDEGGRRGRVPIYPGWPLHPRRRRPGLLLRRSPGPARWQRVSYRRCRPAARRPPTRPSRDQAPAGRRPSTATSRRWRRGRTLWSPA
jgi:hypothetical protein